MDVFWGMTFEEFMEWIKKVREEEENENDK